MKLKKPGEIRKTDLHWIIGSPLSCGMFSVFVAGHNLVTVFDQNYREKRLPAGKSMPGRDPDHLQSENELRG